MVVIIKSRESGKVLVKDNPYPTSVVIQKLGTTTSKYCPTKWC